ncbi:MAG TPA: hypothetical protein VJ276_19180 [Thermoanaerobaculia bacterium]|nr:hypothetical protein [Thermoanaerobaculia bacterium]
MTRVQSRSFAMAIPAFDPHARRFAHELVGLGRRLFDDLLRLAR